MKKKLGRLSALLVAVLCVCLLCVPAFASAPVEGELVEFLPECHPTFVGDDNDFIFAVENSPAFVVGETYIVNWNCAEYVCVAQDISSLIPGAVLVGNGEYVGLVSNGEPFCILTMDGAMSCISMYEISELTISIYQVAPSQSEVIFSNITTYVDALRTQFSIGSLVEVLAYAVGIGVGFVFLWWGVRKAARAIMSGFKKGKLRL